MKERKALTEQIQRTEKEIVEKLDKLPDVLKEDGYPDVQAFMAAYRKAEAVVEQYNRDLAAGEQQIREKNCPKRAVKAAPAGERIKTPATASGRGQATKPAETEKVMV